MNESIQDFIFNNSSNSTEITKIINYTSEFTNNSSRFFLNTSNTTSIISQIDPNWFYSASAQSAVAIVGLMGAFIITKLINHKSFVNQLQKEITECNNKIDSIYREINPKNQYINNLDDETNSKLVDEPLKYPVGMQALLGNYQMPQLSATSLTHNLLDIEANKRKWETYRRYKEEVTEKKAELSYFEYLLHDKKSTLGDKKDILILRNNIITLLLFSVAGIFLPLFMMLCDYDVMMKYRQETYVVILIGWMFVVLNLGADIWHLFKSTKY